MSIYDWSLVPPEFDAVAMNESGEVWMYKLPEARPNYVIHKDYMAYPVYVAYPDHAACRDRAAYQGRAACPAHVAYPAYVAYPGPKPNVDWEDSLELREEAS